MLLLDNHPWRNGSAEIWGKLLCETQTILSFFVIFQSYHAHNGRMHRIYTFQLEIRDDLTLPAIQTTDR